MPFIKNHEIRHVSLLCFSWLLGYLPIWPRPHRPHLLGSLPIACYYSCGYCFFNCLDYLLLLLSFAFSDFSCCILVPLELQFGNMKLGQNFWNFGGWSFKTYHVLFGLLKCLLKVHSAIGFALFNRPLHCSQSDLTFTCVPLHTPCSEFFYCLSICLSDKI